MKDQNASVGEDRVERFSRTSKHSDYFLLEQENVEPAAPWSSVQDTLHNTYQWEIRLMPTRSAAGSLALRDYSTRCCRCDQTVSTVFFHLYWWAVVSVPHHLLPSQFIHLFPLLSVIPFFLPFIAMSTQS